ncbi:hypothetical protein B0H15DRAFT_925649 [Mycena belliarum]|uniref:AB hydrolase-1 domain-containing protein n=1 Tax=Mycena belliarum TaxID=1033014 RepID=A0AAD6XIP2_9AGAR|nr:hypothetical protein B0H15DRAFT_925649 [Mycena belliae]
MAQPYTEHTLKLPDGVEIRYTDSGAPQTVDYTTLVVIHGTGFNGYCFLKLHELAHKYNLRIAIMNRRDYHGSTMFSDEDLADMHAGRRIFQDRLATQVAWFLQHFIEHESTPTVSADRTSGGFLLMGWSSGCSVALAPFADRDVLPSALYDAVEPYLRSLVLYDPPVHTLGYLPPAGTGYDPFKDPECTNPDMLFKMFQLWTASYFSHPDIASGAPQGISVEKYTPKRTTKDWTEEQMARCFEKAAAARSALPASVLPHI